jgi:hypothetical protein
MSDDQFDQPGPDEEPVSPDEEPISPDDPGQSPDPFANLDRLKRRSAPGASGGRKVTLSILVRKPRKNEWFRVLDDEDYMLEAWVLEHEGAGGGRETYFVDPAIADEVDDAREVLLVIGVNSRDTPFVWPLKLPEGQSGNRYAETALEIMEIARQIWVKMWGDRDSLGYAYKEMPGHHDEPKVPDLPFRELLRRGFAGGRFIDNPDHPVLREINGEEL